MRRVVVLVVAAAGNTALTLVVLWLLLIGACELIGGQRMRSRDLARVASQQVDVGMQLADAVAELRSTEGF